MRPSRARAFGFVLLILTVATPLPGQDSKPTPPQPRSVEELITDLGHDLYATRERAQRELWNRGNTVIPALERALQNENPEITRRARELLQKYSWGIRADSPPEVVKLLRAYQNGDNNPLKTSVARHDAIRDLLRHGPAGIAVVRALLAKPLPDDIHTQLVAQVTGLIRREVPLRMFEGKADDAAELIALHAAATSPEGAADYAVFQVLRNNLTAAIAIAETGRRTNHHKLLLAHLYRAAGEWDKARDAAADLPHIPDEPSLAETLREDQGDWNTLADTLAFGVTNHPDALRLSLLRLAGRHKELDDNVKALVKSLEEPNGTPDVFNTVVALFANHHAEEATNILLERKVNLGLLGEVMIARLRYRDALDLVKKELPDSSRLEFNLRRARILMLIGERDEAVKLFNTVAEGLLPKQVQFSNSNNPIVAIRSLIRTEMRLGLKDQAAEHAAQFVASGLFQQHGGSFTGESAFELVFAQDSTVAETIFTVLRQKNIPGKEAGPTMLRTRDLITGKASKAAVEETLAILRQALNEKEPPPGPGDPGLAPPAAPGLAPIPPPQPPGDGIYVVWPPPPTKGAHFLAIAAICRAANRDDEADAAFRVATDLTDDAADGTGARSWAFGVSDAYRPFVEWGDFLADRGRYRDAANRYLAGWKKFPDQPLPMFLSGKALVKAGDTKEGERRIELSHWVSLGQERIRGRFLDELVRRGEGKAAKRETELVLRACWCRDFYFGNVMNQAAKASVLVKDYATAEKCAQRSLLLLLKTPGMYYVETGAYMGVPHDILMYRTRAQLTAGNVAEAMTLAREALAITPGHVDLVSSMVPELENRGKKAEADELFTLAWKAHQKVLADFPNSPAARNSLAALAANCRRDLDRGLAYAKEAVKADPGSTAFRETLAEIQFRTGHREAAVTMMAKLLEDEPRNVLYKRQHARYRTAAFDSSKSASEE